MIPGRPIVFLSVLQEPKGRGTIYRGHAPQDGTEWGEICRKGIHKILNLESGLRELIHREANEEVRLARWRGIDVAHVRLHPFLAPELRDLDLVVDIIVELAPFTVLVHCAKGHERTGIGIGAWRIRECGWTAERAWLEMRACGFHAIYALLGWKRRLRQYEQKWARRRKPG